MNKIKTNIMYDMAACAMDAGSRKKQYRSYAGQNISRHS
jgi:hypothetical protein